MFKRWFIKRRTKLIRFHSLNVTRLGHQHYSPKKLKMSIAGKYNFVSSDKYDEYLKAVGVGLIKRNLANAAKPTLEWIDNGNDSWTQKTISTLKNFEITFTLGEEFDETTADDRTAKSIVTIEGDKLIHKQTIGDNSSITTRTFNGDEMTTSYSVKDVIATRVYKKIA